MYNLIWNKNVSIYGPASYYYTLEQVKIVRAAQRLMADDEGRSHFPQAVVVYANSNIDFPLYYGQTCWVLLPLKQKHEVVGHGWFPSL